MAKGALVALGVGTAVLADVGEGDPDELGKGVGLGSPGVLLGVTVGVSIGVSVGLSVGVSVGMGGRGMGDSLFPLAVLGTLVGVGVGVEGLVTGEGEVEGLVRGLLGAGVGEVAGGQR